MKITFLPDKTVCESSGGETLLRAAAEAGLSLSAECAGKGTCGKCRARVVSGEMNETRPEEERLLSARELRDGWRLACMAVPRGDCVVELPLAGDALYKGNLRFPEDFAPEKDGEARFGVAFDIGTTTIAGMLLDLSEGKLLAAASRANPQGRYGADVISRIEYCSREKNGLKTLQGLVGACLDELAGEIAAAAGIQKRSITRALAVGNTTMTHILMGVDPASLAKAPFSPVFCAHEPVAARSAGLKLALRAKLSILPNIAGHVGADISAAILSSRIMDSGEPAMLIDIGTNGEMAFVKDGRLLVCSTAAGPAFEGACISSGMRAEPGAIIRAEMVGGRFLVTAEGNARPVGICGSGLIDIVAMLLEHHAIDASGKLLSADAAREGGAPEAIASRIRKDGRLNSFVLYEDDERSVALTQKDVREVQLAKAAIAAGMRILMKELSIAPEELSRVLLAGAFGSRIRPASALRLGILPNVTEGKIVQLGNAAGAGACMALLSGKEELRAKTLAARAEHVELAASPDFQGEFISAMRF